MPARRTDAKRATCVELWISSSGGTRPACDCESADVRVRSAGGTRGHAACPTPARSFDQVVGLELGELVGARAGGRRLHPLPITPTLGFEPGALYVMKGVELTERSGKGTVDVRIHYLDIPLLLRYRIDSVLTSLRTCSPGQALASSLSSSGKLEGPSGSLEQERRSGAQVARRRARLRRRHRATALPLRRTVTAGFTDVATTTYPHTDSLRNKTFLLLAV